MALYTLVVQVADEMAQDDLVAVVDDLEVDVGDGRGRLEVMFCGPGSLVQAQGEPVCELCADPVDGTSFLRDGKTICAGCEQIAEYADANRDMAVGERVRAVFPNSGWGEGVVTHVGVDDGRVKPLVVRRDDGEVGYFPYEGVARVVAAEPQPLSVSLSMVGQSVIVSLEMTPDGPLVQLRGKDCRLEGKRPGEYYLTA